MPTSDFIGPSRPAGWAVTLSGQVIRPGRIHAVEQPMYDHPQYRDPRTGRTSGLKRRGWVLHGTVKRKHATYDRFVRSPLSGLRGVLEEVDDDIIPMHRMRRTGLQRVRAERGWDEVEERRHARDVRRYGTREATFRARLRLRRSVRRLN